MPRTTPARMLLHFTLCRTGDDCCACYWLAPWAQWGVISGPVSIFTVPWCHQFVIAQDFSFRQEHANALQQAPHKDFHLIDPVFHFMWIYALIYLVCAPCMHSFCSPLSHFWYGGHNEWAVDFKMEVVEICQLKEVEYWPGFPLKPCQAILKFWQVVSSTQIN